MYLGSHFNHPSAPAKDLPPAAEPEVVANEPARQS